MHTLILGYAKGLLTMFVKRKKNRSGTTSVVVAEKTKGIYKELITIGVPKIQTSMLKVSEIKMSVDKVLALAKTITTIQIKLPLNKEVYTQTMLMARHQKIAKLFDEDFWGTQ